VGEGRSFHHESWQATGLAGDWIIRIFFYDSAEELTTEQGLEKLAESLKRQSEWQGLMGETELYFLKSYLKY
jgi:hypothetical protein